MSDIPQAPVVVVDPTDPPRVDRRKQVLGGLVTLVVLVIVFVGIFPKFANYGDAIASIQDMSVAALVALGVATVLNILIYVLPYQAALPGHQLRERLQSSARRRS